MKFKTIASRIFTMLLPTVIATTLAFAAFSYYVSNARINAIIDERMQQSLRAAGSEIQIELQKNIAVAEALARYGRTLSPETFDHKRHEQFLAEMIASNEHTSGGGVWYDPYAFDPEMYYFGPSFYMDTDGVGYYTRQYEEYGDYFTEDWYIRGKDARERAVWSNVHYDPFSKDMRVTAAKAFYGADGTFRGIGTAEMSIESIRHIAQRITIGNTGRAFIVGPMGEFISFINEASLEHHYKSLAELGMELASADEGSTLLALDGEKLRIYYTSMADTGWTLAIFIEEREIRESTLIEAVFMTIIPVAGLALLVVGLVLIVRYLRRIIHKVNDIAEQAAKGDLSRTIAVTETDEFGVMEQRLNVMIENMYLMRRRSDELLDVAERRENLLHAANRAAAVLLASDEAAFESSLRESMELMARCMDVDRVYIWRNETIKGITFYEAMYEWTSEAGRTEMYPQVGTSYAYAEGVSRWEETFKRRECVNGPLSALSDEERQRLEKYDVVSVLVIPIYLQDRFWGFISFDDCRTARYFTEDEVDILRSVGLMMASAVVRNQTAAQVREADDRMRLLLDAMPLCCTLFDRDLRVIDCNEEAVKLYGVPDKETYRRMFFSLMPEYQPDGSHSLTRAKEMVNAAFEKGRVVSEWMHLSARGERIPAEAVLVRIRHDRQDIVAGYTRDLREYKKILDEREHKNRLLRAVNKAAAVLLASNMDEFDRDLIRCMGMLAKPVNADRVYIWKNTEEDGKLCCTQLYEWSEGATPQHGQQFTLALPYAENIPTWEETLSQGHSINGIVRELTPDEQRILTPQGILSILVVPVFLRDYFWGFVGFDDCHSERVFSSDEETILRSGGLLIANALLRNEMNLQIHAAVEAAETASRAKSSFLSNMSHEIRTPINAITGMTLIGKKAVEAEQKNYALDKIEAASMHLLGVINDILDMSKIEANKFTLSEVPFNFEKTLQRAVNVINFRVDEKRQHFTVYMDGNLPATLIGDDQRLTQVITNLLSNAVKFTPEGGQVRLDARLIREEDGLCTIEIAVSDTGIGIDPSRLGCLFESFEQAERSISRQYGGTGLGLAITKHITELMGGHIRVESTPETGSVFTVTVTLPRGADNERGAGLSRAALQRVRVLFVDDEPEARVYFEEIAERSGFVCDTTGSGAEALACIDDKGPYHLYFVDWRMPEMDGVALTHAIKSQDSELAVVIMVSAAEWSEIEQSAREAGVNRFLSKPLFPSAVLDCIQEYMSMSHTAMEAPPEDALSFAGRHVLLVEDVEINREILITLLSATGIAIDCATNGLEAVRMFEEAPGRYDLIFMDVQMPEMDGLTATRRIRASNNADAADIPIVAMTANVFKDDIAQCKAAGMNAHLGKPLDFAEVLAMMKRYL